MQQGVGVQGSDQGLGIGGGGVARLGVVGVVVYGGCQPRIEGIDKCKNKVLYNIKSVGAGGQI